MPTTFAASPTRLVSAANGIEYAYRETGEGGTPVVLFQHFRGNLDNWDPALIDALAATRRVITFDNAGVGATTGRTPATIAGMARDAIAFLDAMGIGQADLLGFSIGSFIAQQIALSRPAAVHRLVLASSAPQGAEGMHGWAPDVIEAVGSPRTESRGSTEGLLRTVTDQPRGRKAVARPDSLPHHRPGQGRRPGKRGWPSTTPCAIGASRTTHSCSA